MQAAARYSHAAGIKGSSTCCIVLIDTLTGRLTSANLGDSGFMVLGSTPDRWVAANGPACLCQPLTENESPWASLAAFLMVVQGSASSSRGRLLQPAQASSHKTGLGTWQDMEQQLAGERLMQPDRADLASAHLGCSAVLNSLRTAGLALSAGRGPMNSLRTAWACCFCRQEAHVLASHCLGLLHLQAGGPCTCFALPGLALVAGRRPM